MAKKIFEKIVETPADVLSKGIEEVAKAEKKLSQEKPIKVARRYWHILGPGLTTGAADDDPSGIATYSQTGARYGFQLLWLAPLTFPLMAVVQEICARIGMVTGRGLAANIRQHYPRWVLYLCAGLLFFSNTFNLGADLGVMAKATQLLFPGLTFALLVIGFALLSLALQIFVSYERYSKYLKYLALALLCYVFSTLSIKLNWLEIFKHSLIPSLNFSKEQIFLICGILGTTISPYLFFWQPSQEVEEEIKDGKTRIEMRQGASVKELKNMRTDVWSGMIFSNAAMFFIIVACAGTLFVNGLTNINTAQEAALALRPFAGNFAYLLFTLGIIGVGLLGVPILAGSASYALSESFGWRHGLYRKLKQASAFYSVIIVSVLAGLLMNFIGLDPIKTLIYAAVINGIVAPVILVLIMGISSDKKIMGERVNGPLTKGIGWLTTLLMIVVGAATIAGFFV